MSLRDCLAAVLALSIATPALAEQACLRTSPATVTLVGKVYPFTDYGPPGYGETPDLDAKRSYQGLTMDFPICARGRGKSDFHVGLIEIPGGVPEALFGQEVRITGQLTRTGAEEPPFLRMKVTRIQPNAAK